MKSAKTTKPSQDNPQPTPFEQFAKAMRALIAVPKRELDEMLAKEKADKRANHVPVGKGS